MKYFILVDKSGLFTLLRQGVSYHYFDSSCVLWYPFGTISGFVPEMHVRSQNSQAPI